jgi:hypothetical protein
MTARRALALAIVLFAASVTMSAEPMSPDTPVSRVGSVTIRYAQIASPDPRSEQIELDARIVDAMLDPILAKHGLSVSDDDIATAMPPVMKRPNTVRDSVDVHRRVAAAIRKVHAGADAHRVYEEELSRDVLHAAGIAAMISERSFAGYVDALRDDAAIDRFLRDNSAEKTEQRYREVATRTAKHRKVDELVRRYAAEKTLAFDVAQEQFWTRMASEIGVKILAPGYRIPTFRKDLP